MQIECAKAFIAPLENNVSQFNALKNLIHISDFKQGKQVKTIEIITTDCNKWSKR